MSANPTALTEPVEGPPQDVSLFFFIPTLLRWWIVFVCSVQSVPSFEVLASCSLIVHFSGSCIGLCRSRARTWGRHCRWWWGRQADFHFYTRQRRHSGSRRNGHGRRNPGFLYSWWVFSWNLELSLQQPEMWPARLDLWLYLTLCKSFLFVIHLYCILVAAADATGVVVDAVESTVDNSMSSVPSTPAPEKRTLNRMITEDVTYKV